MREERYAMPKRRVLITGAEGNIGTALRERLADRYDLSSLTLTPQEFESHVADIADLDAIQPAFAGVDAVVHLAAAASLLAPWEDVLPNNIVGTYNVYEAARREGVERVVFASSHHAVGMYEIDQAPDLYDVDAQRFDHHVELRPDSLYGVSKAYGEALGRMYVDRHGLRVFCLRIAAVRPDDDPTTTAEVRLLERLDDEGRRNRWRAVWLSKRDCAELVARCLDVDDVHFAIVYGVSANERRFWDIEHARDLLGWSPQDAAPA